MLRPVTRAVSAVPAAAYHEGRGRARHCILCGDENDQSSLAAPALSVAQRAADATVIRVPGGHYAPFLEQHDSVVDAELDFLERHLTPD